MTRILVTKQHSYTARKSDAWGAACVRGALHDDGDAADDDDDANIHAY